MNVPPVLKNIIKNHKDMVMKEIPNNEEKLYKYYDKLIATPVNQTDLEIITTKRLNQIVNMI